MQGEGEGDEGSWHIHNAMRTEEGLFHPECHKNHKNPGITRAIFPKYTDLYGRLSHTVGPSELLNGPKRVKKVIFLQKKCHLFLQKNLGESSKKKREKSGQADRLG